jgi:hypothetical protein
VWLVVDGVVQIEYQVKNAANHVEEGTLQVQGAIENAKKARKYQVRRTTWRCCHGMRALLRPLMQTHELELTGGWVSLCSAVC